MTFRKCNHSNRNKKPKPRARRQRVVVIAPIGVSGLGVRDDYEIPIGTLGKINGESEPGECYEVKFDAVTLFMVTEEVESSLVAIRE